MMSLKPKPIKELIITTILTMMVSVAGITFYFFIIVTMIEQISVNKNMNRVKKWIVDNIPGMTNEAFNDILGNVKVSNKQDDKVKQHNYQLTKNTLIKATLVILGLSVLLVPLKPSKHHFIESIITLILLLVVEFSFAMMVAAQWISVDLNHLALTILRKIPKNDVINPSTGKEQSSLKQFQQDDASSASL